MTGNASRIGRREFLHHSAIGLGVSLVGCGAPGAPSANREDNRAADMRADERRVIVFQGDSITDAGRNKQNQQANIPHTLGSGYVGLAVAQLLGENPGSRWECYNRGISGHKVFQLADRWQEDALDLTPDVLSILIGVNDFWHTLTGGYEGTVDIYERDVRALLDRTREELPDVHLIIGEPFTVEGGTAINEQWHPAFDEYRAAAQRVAQEYQAAWIPYQRLFDEALEQAPAGFWAPDGVHPAPAGNYLMARAWLDALRETLTVREEAA